MVDTFRGLGLPVLACVLGTSSFLIFGGDGCTWLVMALVAGGLMYLSVLFGFSGSVEEKQFAHDFLSRLKLITMRMYWRDRGSETKINFP